MFFVSCILIYCISRPIRHTFFPEKCDLNSTCILCAEGKNYFQTYKYPYIYYTTSLSWDSENNHEDILVAVMMIFWVSVMNKLYCVCWFCYVTILFSSNKLLKLKYIHNFFFIKFLTKKSRCVLWARKYGNHIMLTNKMHWTLSSTYKTASAIA